MDIGEIKEGDEIVAVDAAIFNLIACRPVSSLACAVQPGRIRPHRLSIRIMLFQRERAGDESRFIKGEFLDEGPDSGMHRHRLQCPVEGEAVLVSTAFAGFQVARTRGEPRRSRVNRRMDISVNSLLRFLQRGAGDSVFDVQVACYVKQIALFRCHGSLSFTFPCYC